MATYNSLRVLRTLPLLLFLSVPFPSSDLETNKSDHFVKFLQYTGFFAYLLMKAASLHCLLKNIKADSHRKEALMNKYPVSVFFEV